MMRATAESTQITVSSEDQEAYNVEDYPPVQVIICSCTAQSHGIHIKSPGSKTTAYAVPELPELQNLLSTFMHLDTTRIKLQEQQENLQSLLDVRSHFQNLNLVSRAGKYLRDPRKIGTLAKRTRVQTRGLLRCLSFQLIFNIAAVIIWLLIRKTLELFGIRIGPQVASVKPERPRIPTDRNARGLTRRATTQNSVDKGSLKPTVEDYDSWEHLGSFLDGK